MWTGENDTKTISVDGNRFENGVVWTGSKKYAQSSEFSGLTVTGKKITTKICPKHLEIYLMNASL